MKITKLKPNEIFVFGSNTQGIHGSGAAKQAVEFGAVCGVAEGLSGQTYAIPTKNLAKGMRSVSLDDISLSYSRLLLTAISMPYNVFLVTPFGTGLAGYSVKEIADIVNSYPSVSNVVLPEEFKECYKYRSMSDIDRCNDCYENGFPDCDACSIGRRILENKSAGIEG